MIKIHRDALLFIVDDEAFKVMYVSSMTIIACGCSGHMLDVQ